MLKSRFTILLLFIACISQAQVNRYMVFFSDKANTLYSSDRPEEFLSPRSLDKRISHNISITEEDLPVNPSYIDSLTSLDIQTFFSTKWMNGVLVQASEEQLPVLESLEFVKSIEFVAPGEKLLTSSRQSKSRIENSDIDSGPFPSSFQLNSLGINHLHKEGNIGQGRLIAFFDGGYLGVDQSDGFSHVFDSGRLRDAWNFVSNSDNVYQLSTHGTRVFSATAGYEEDVFEGAAHGADFMLFVTEDASSEYRIEEYNWLFAAEYADSAGVDIINASVGYYDFDDPAMNYAYADMDGETTVITRAADKASAKGILVVVSGGNEGNRPWQFVTAPADGDSVLEVGSVDRTDLRSNFSSIGPTADGRIKPDVTALGSSTALISSDGNITSGSGTSFSAPLVTGLAALLWNENPTLNNIELLNLIRSLGDRAQSPDNEYGYGIPSIVGEPEAIEPFDISIFPNPVGSDELNLVLGVLESDLNIKIRFYDMLGHLVSENDFVATPGFCELRYNVANIPQGAYILEISSSLISKRLRIIRS